MRTTRSISNIAYQSPAYFETVVNSLKKADIIGPCFWIAHKGEGDDAKDHIHFVLLGGSKTYNTDGLSGLFGFEPQPDGSVATVTGRWFVTKDINDWLAYSVHNVKYLFRKLKEKVYNYDWADLRCTNGDEDTLRLSINDAKEFIEDKEDRVYRAIRLAVKNKMTWRETVLSGLLPVNTLGSAYTVFRMMNGECDDGRDCVQTA